MCQIWGVEMRWDEVIHDPDFVLLDLALCEIQNKMLGISQLEMKERKFPMHPIDQF